MTTNTRWHRKPKCPHCGHYHDSYEDLGISWNDRGINHVVVCNACKKKFRVEHMYLYKCFVVGDLDA